MYSLIPLVGMLVPISFFVLIGVLVWIGARHRHTTRDVVDDPVILVGLAQLLVSPKQVHRQVGQLFRRDADINTGNLE